MAASYFVYTNRTHRGTRYTVTHWLTGMDVCIEGVVFKNVSSAEICVFHREF